MITLSSPQNNAQCPNKCRLEGGWWIIYVRHSNYPKRSKEKIPIHTSLQNSSRDSFVALERGSLFVVLRAQRKWLTIIPSRHKARGEKCFLSFSCEFVCLVLKHRSFCWVCQVLKRIKFSMNWNSLHPLRLNDWAKPSNDITLVCKQISDYNQQETCSH